MPDLVADTDSDCSPTIVEDTDSDCNITDLDGSSLDSADTLQLGDEADMPEHANPAKRRRLRYKQPDPITVVRTRSSERIGPKYGLTGKSYRRLLRIRAPMVLFNILCPTAVAEGTAAAAATTPAAATTASDNG